jgi:hypothetical protein
MRLNESDIVPVKQDADIHRAAETARAAFHREPVLLGYDRGTGAEVYSHFGCVKVRFPR